MKNIQTAMKNLNKAAGANSVLNTILADRYRFLMNKDIEDFSIGIRNIKTRKEMEDIEKRLSRGGKK